jgi:hypothetical protein
VKKIRINDEIVQVRDAEDLAQKVRTYARDRGIKTFVVQIRPDRPDEYVSPDGLSKAPFEEIEAVRVVRYFSGA